MSPSTLIGMHALQVFFLWMGALVLTTMEFGDPASNTHASDAAAALLWFGSIWWVVKQIWGCAVQLWLHREQLAIEKSLVCSNMGFVFHRNNEFMFLMYTRPNLDPSTIPQLLKLAALHLPHRCVHARLIRSSAPGRRLGETVLQIVIGVADDKEAGASA